MLRVLRHYLPLRRALLVFSETALLGGVLAAGMAAHLWAPDNAVAARVILEGLSLADARRVCLFSAFSIAVLAQIAIAFNELYDFRVSSSRYDRASRFVGSTGTAIMIALAGVFLARSWELRRVLQFPGLQPSQLYQTLVFTLLFGFSLLYVWRHLFHLALRRWNFNERVLVLGAGPAALSLVREMLEHNDSGFETVGMVPEPPSASEGPARRGAPPQLPRFVRERGPKTAGLTTGLTAGEAGVAFGERAKLDPSTEAALATLVLEPLEFAASSSEPAVAAGPRRPPTTLFELVKNLAVDIVVVALEDRRGHLPTEELLRCRLAGIAVKEREAIYEQITGKLAVEALRPSYLIFNDGFGRSARGEAAKRTVDILLSVLALAILWPAMLLTAIVVRMDSSGPALFSQERVGRDGKRFTLYKFRSMRADAEKSTGPVWAQKGDPRITRSGRFMRKSRLDELPQLFNVLVGDMSLVGPRPERQVFVDELALQIPYFNQRHIVKPGLTGWAQINYPYGNTVEDALQKLQYDLFYIKNQSLLFDLSILFQTIKTVVLRRGT
jgi:exopolysaccharide biosynthesis polyprenyl glycosylphosphotransferase